MYNLKSYFLFYRHKISLSYILNDDFKHSKSNEIYGIKGFSILHFYSKFYDLKNVKKCCNFSMLWYNKVNKFRH